MATKLTDFKPLQEENKRLKEINYELLEALEAMLAVYPAGGKGDVEDRNKACNIAKSAIAKAKGL